MARITADMARELAGVVDIEKDMEFAYNAIEQSAKTGGRTVILRSDLFSQGGLNCVKEWLKAVDELRTAGYAVEFFYEERQFVDMGTKVSW